jgi:hypothetical protein
MKDEDMREVLSALVGELENQSVSTGVDAEAEGL